MTFSLYSLNVSSVDPFSFLADNTGFVLVYILTTSLCFVSTYVSAVMYISKVLSSLFEGSGFIRPKSTLSFFEFGYIALVCIFSCVLFISNVYGAIVFVTLDLQECFGLFVTLSLPAVYLALGFLRQNSFKSRACKN